MIKSLKALLQTPPSDDEETQRRSIRLAAAVLLVETARADFTEDITEMNKLTDLLKSSLQLRDDEVHDLVTAAKERVEESTSLFDFTRIINDHYNAEQKLELIRAMWAVAYADGNLSKYEEHLIRQVADLTYVTHSDYIHCKVATRP
jgi:uncharacterized tellurite resistance protein B-like protein|tara:strand:+ start:5724 stop:6164 length:441 start_codon:yes stop_codon:yes gene_type:complete